MSSILTRSRHSGFFRLPAFLEGDETHGLCWFAARVVAVRQRWGLTIDAREAAALETVLSGCATTELDAGGGDWADAAQGSVSSADALRLWDDNGNGTITCAEARRHGIAPVRRGHPAYPFMRDADGDGVVCERNDG